MIVARLWGIYAFYAIGEGTKTHCRCHRSCILSPPSVQLHNPNLTTQIHPSHAWQKLWPSGAQALEDSWSPAPNDCNVRATKNCDWASGELLQDALDEATKITSQTSDCPVLNALDTRWLTLFMSAIVFYHTSHLLHTNLTVMIASPFGISVMCFRGFLPFSR